MLNTKDSLLLVIDIQEKLVRASKDSETISKKAGILSNAAKILSVPVIITEQYPKGLGSTVAEIKEACEADYVEKTNFSALKEPGFKEKLDKLSKKQIILCGIETHICVYQTCLDLLESGYEVYVVRDCCSSRNEFEHCCGLESMQAAGANLVCVEMVLFECLEGSKHPLFKDIQALIK